MSELSAADLEQIADALYGDAAFEVSKAMGDSKKERRDKVLQNVALGTNAVGSVAGPAAIGLAWRSAKKNEGGTPRAYAPNVANTFKKSKRPKLRKIGQKIDRAVDALNAPKSRGTKIAAGATGATLVGLQGINWGGDMLSTKLINDQKKKSQPVAKFKGMNITEHQRRARDSRRTARRGESLAGLGGAAVMGSAALGARVGAPVGMQTVRAARGFKTGAKLLATGNKATRAAVPQSMRAVARANPYGTGVLAGGTAMAGGLATSAAARGNEKRHDRAISNLRRKRVAKSLDEPRQLRALKTGHKVTFQLVDEAPAVKKKLVKKSDDVLFRGEISKRDDDKRQVFGWASVIEVDGQPVVDYQGDIMELDVIESAAYDYVQKSRKGGNMHQRAGEEPLHVSDLVESFVLTPEKKEQMGLPETAPTGWWVGFKVNDEATWQEVKDGKLKEFSIHGKGVRRAVEEMAA